MSTLTERRSARKLYMKAKKKPLGEGSRFAAVAKIVAVSGAHNPEAVAAAIGRRKYGNKKMAKLAVAGRKV